MKEQSVTQMVGFGATMKARTPAPVGNIVVVTLASHRTQMDIVNNALIHAGNYCQSVGLMVLPGAPGLTWIIARTLNMIHFVVVMQATRRTHREIAWLVLSIVSCLLGKALQSAQPAVAGVRRHKPEVFRRVQPTTVLNVLLQSKPAYRVIRNRAPEMNVRMTIMAQ